MCINPTVLSLSTNVKIQLLVAHNVKTSSRVVFMQEIAWPLFFLLFFFVYIMYRLQEPCGGLKLPMTGESTPNKYRMGFMIFNNLT